MRKKTVTSRANTLYSSGLPYSITNNPFLQPDILTLYLSTLTLLIHTFGPHAPSLPQITTETLTLLMPLHNYAAINTDPIVVPALLRLFLAILDTNIARGIAGEEYLVSGDALKMVIELRDWTQGVFERVSAGEEKMLAGGVLVVIGDVFQRYEGRIMGVTGLGQ